MIDSRVYPRPLFRNLREQTKLVASAGYLAFEPCHRQCRLPRGPFDNITPDCLNSVSNLSEKRAALAARRAAVLIECIRREPDRTVHFFRRCRIEPRLQWLTRSWIPRIERISGTRALAKTNQRAPGKLCHFTQHAAFTSYGLNLPTAEAGGFPLRSAVLASASLTCCP